MSLYRFLFLFFLFSVFNSCQDILDESYKKEMNELYTSPYMGKWAGSFNGQESGSFSISVAKNGNISGTFGSNSELIYGAVLDNGALLPLKSNSSALILYGSLLSKDGSWKQNDLSGIWTITKQ